MVRGPVFQGVIEVQFLTLGFLKIELCWQKSIFLFPRTELEISMGVCHMENFLSPWVQSIHFESVYFQQLNNVSIEWKLWDLKNVY